MKYFHVRKNGNQLCATIAAESTPTGVKYGVAIVSTTELRGKVAYATGRTIAGNRIGKWLDWKPFHTPENPIPRNVIVQTFASAGFGKAGAMHELAFRASLKAVRAALNDTYIAKKSKKDKKVTAEK